MERRCSFCHELKDMDLDFYRDKTRGHGRAAVCKVCTPTKRRQYNRKAKWVSSSKQRLHALAILGPVCLCCSETFIDYLQIDHVDNDGAEHRRTMRSSGAQSIYRYVIANPTTDRLQVLCANCHMFKTRYKKLCKDRHNIGISLVPSAVLPIPKP